MYIDEMPIGSPINVHIVSESNTYELVSIIRYKERPAGPNHSCLIELFSRDDYSLPTNLNGCYVMVENIVDGKLYKYRVCAINPATYNQRDYLSLVSIDNVKFVNRRRDIRMPLFTEATLSCDKFSMMGTTKDISASGIAIVFKTPTPPNIGERVRCVFILNETKYSASCTIVRYMKDKKNGTILVGCEFDRNYRDINELVNNMQLSKGIT